MSEEITQIRDKLTRLSRTKDPVARDEIARELIAQAPQALRAVRAQAARDAVAGGMRPSEYARAIGRTPGAVNLLLSRDHGTRA